MERPAVKRSVWWLYGAASRAWLQLSHGAQLAKSLARSIARDVGLFGDAVRDTPSAAPDYPSHDEDDTCDVIDRASMESFPASDPPGWIGSRAERQ